MGWTCPECGLDYDTIAPPDIPVAIRSYPRRYREAMALRDAEDDAVLRTRAEKAIWSALEYASHVEDSYDAFTEQFRTWLASGKPSGGNWDPDERATERGYNKRDPETVLADLKTHAESLAQVLDGVKPEQWSLTTEFPWGERDLLTMARNAVHEGKHHLRDIEMVLSRVRATT